MLLGRIVWGTAMWRLSELVTDMTFTWEMFITGAFVDALPGIILHILIIPPIVMVMRKVSRNAR